MNLNKNNSQDQIQNTEQQPDQQQEHQPMKRINPRWFQLADPDQFFSDLLMEQEEQG